MSSEPSSCNLPTDSRPLRRPIAVGVVIVAVVSLGGCGIKLNDHSAVDADATGGGPAPARNGGAGGGTTPTGAGGNGGIDAPQSPPASGMTTCGPGTHLCSGVCVRDDLPESCGSSCEPCPPVMGGTTSCVERACTAKCPAGQKPCRDKCVPEADACGDDCGPGRHSCGGLCVDNNKVSSCGTSCTACPAAPPGGVASCDGTKCGFDCMMGKRCGERCGECCADQDCGAQAGKAARCDQATLRCKYDCPSGTKDCNGKCVPNASCCTDADCPMSAGKVGQCDTSTGSCGYSCAADQKPCGGQCISMSGCCDDSACMGNLACTNNVCSTTMCKAGFKMCSGQCIPSSMCCRADGCCADTDCGRCEKCSNSQCIPQSASEDVKNECADGTCKSGNCDGNRGCGNVVNGQKSEGCNADCRECQNGSCQNRTGSCQGNRMCSSGNCVEACRSNASCKYTRVACRAGRISCDTGSPVCGEGEVDDNAGGCGSNAFCQRGRCVNCGRAGQPCCPGDKCTQQWTHCRAFDGNPKQCHTCGESVNYCCNDRTCRPGAYCDNGGAQSTCICNGDNMHPEIGCG